MDRTLPERKTTLIGILLMLYFSIIACENSARNIYGGFIALAGAIIIDNIFSKDRLKVRFPFSCKLFYYFTVYTFFGRIWAHDLYFVGNLSRQIIAVLLLIAIPTNYFIKKKNPSAVIAAVACVGVILSMYVIKTEGGFSAFYEHATREGARVGKEVSNVNRIGMAAALSSVVLAFYSFVMKKRWCIPLCALTFMVTAASGSRKSLLLLGAGVFLMILLTQKDRQAVVKFFKMLFWLIIGFFVLKFLFSLEIMSAVRVRWDGLIASLTGDSINADASADSRIKMLKFGWEQFRQHPFLGVGIGNSKVLYWENYGSYMYLHNDYIEQLVNGGIFGFLLYYGNILYLFVKHIKLMKIKKDPEIVMSFIILVLFLIMNTACVTYYDFLQTALYFTLWITTVEVKKIEFANLENPPSDEGKEITGGGAVKCVP